MDGLVARKNKLKAQIKTLKVGLSHARCLPSFFLFFFFFYLACCALLAGAQRALG